MPAASDFYRTSILAGSVFGLLTATAASAAPISPVAPEIHSDEFGFGAVVTELVRAPHTIDLAHSSGGPGVGIPVGQPYYSRFGGRNTNPPIEQLRFGFDLTGSVAPIADGNASSYPAIGRSPALDHGDRLNPIVAIPLPSGGLLALLGLGLIGVRRNRSVP